MRPDSRLVADHARMWARGGVISDPLHVATAPAKARTTPAVDDLVRDLADYDRALGLSDGGEVA